MSVSFWSKAFLILFWSAVLSGIAVSVAPFLLKEPQYYRYYIVLPIIAGIFGVGMLGMAFILSKTRPASGHARSAPFFGGLGSCLLLVLFFFLVSSGQASSVYALLKIAPLLIGALGLVASYFRIPVILLLNGLVVWGLAIIGIVGTSMIGGYLLAPALLFLTSGLQLYAAQEADSS